MSYSGNELTKITNYYLPRNAKLVQIKEYYESPAIINGDIDGDGSVEVIALYEKEERMYIFILKQINQKWRVIWNSKIEFNKIIKFQIAHILEKKAQIAIGGEVEGRVRKQLMLLGWEEEGLSYMVTELIAFDKVYIQDVDGMDRLDEIIIWEHKKLEAYDIKIYRYKDGKLGRDTALDQYYNKEIRSYYEYLCDIYPDEEVYRQYLDRINEKTATEIKELPRNGELLNVYTAYPYQIEEEEEIYIIGRYQRNEVESYLVDVQLIITSNKKTKYNRIKIDYSKIYDLEIFVGDFTGNGLDDIWVGIYSHQQKKEKDISIYSYQKPGIERIGCYKQLIEAYPIDINLEDKYDIEMIKRGEQQKEYKIIWLEWKNREFEVYRQCLI